MQPSHTIFYFINNIGPGGTLCANIHIRSSVHYFTSHEKGRQTSRASNILRMKCYALNIMASFLPTLHIPFTSTTMAVLSSVHTPYKIYHHSPFPRFCLFENLEIGEERQRPPIFYSYGSFSMSFLLSQQFVSFFIMSW